MEESAMASTAMLLFGIAGPYHSPIEDPGYTADEIVAFLLDRFPVDVPVTIRVGTPLDGDMGAVDYDGWQFILWADPRLSSWEVRDTLFHEWAHVLAETYTPEEPEHGPHWGLWYADIWSAWHDGG
jgi:hypothetical protein